MVDLSADGAGKLIDPDGRCWTVRRRRLDLRTVRSAMRHPGVRILIGEGGGAVLEWLSDSDREVLRARLRRRYGLPLNASSEPLQYVGHELIDEAGERLLYFETWC